RGAACCAPTPSRPSKRYFTPRKSPDPSSPTVAANNSGRAMGTRAATSASATATSAAKPRALSLMPGPSSRWPRRSAATSTPGSRTTRPAARASPHRCARDDGAPRGCARARAGERCSDPPIHSNSLDGARRVGDTSAMEERELIYDWNRSPTALDWSRARVDLNDETLRDGLQSPSVRDPSLEVKKRLLHLMADLGIVAADIGLPGAGPRVV